MMAKLMTLKRKAYENIMGKLFGWLNDVLRSFNPFPNSKFQTLPNLKGLQTKILNLMKVTKGTIEV